MSECRIVVAEIYHLVRGPSQGEKVGCAEARGGRIAAGPDSEEAIVEAG